MIPEIRTKTFNSLVDAWRAGWSEDYFNQLRERFLNSEWYQIYEEGISQGHGDPLRLTGIEEFGYVGEQPRWLNKIFGKIPTTVWSERVFVSGINEELRYAFDKLYANLKMEQSKIAEGKLKAPKNGYDLKREFWDMQDYLANTTGRARLGDIKPKSATWQILNSLFFSARFKLGRLLTPIHLIGLNKVGPDAHFSRRIMRRAWRDLGSLIAFMATLEVLGDQMGWWEVENDPASTDFAKIKIGDTRIDPWGGLQQFVVLLYRIFSKQSKSSTSGEDYETDLGNTLFNFMEKSGSPALSAAMEAYTGETFTGEEIDLADVDQWINRVAPFIVQDIYDVFVEGSGDAGMAGIAGALGFLGVGVTTYSDTATPSGGGINRLVPSGGGSGRKNPLIR